ncbi:MAG: hypothetical protein ACFFBP_18385 [Promethearchaeota archaeon]
MSKKLTFTAVILLLFGSVILPVGVIADQYIGDLVSANLDTGLIGIRDEAGPIVENMVNVTFSSTMFYLANGICDANYDGSETFFNDISEDANITYTESTDTVELLCPSYYYGKNLSFTPEAQSLLLFGSGIKGQSGYIPGLINDTLNLESNAWDAIEFFENYAIASTNPLLIAEMETNYQCTWDQLTALVNYTRIYVFYNRIPKVLEDGKHLVLRPELSVVDDTIQAIAYYYFLIQWANGELVSAPGFPLPLGFMEAYGLEAGIPNPLNLTYNEAEALWNETNEYALTNPLGIERWKAARDNPDSSIASYLMSEFGLTAEQMKIILNWLQDFEYELMPFLAQYLYGLPADTNALANTLGMGGIILGVAMIGLSTIAILGSTVSKKKPKSKTLVSQRVSQHVFLSGLQEKDDYTENNYDQGNGLYEEKEDDNYE